MEKQTLLALARELISDAETGKALDMVEDFLKKESKYKTLYREALQLLSLYNKTKRDEQKSLISFDNAKLSYGQVSNGLLDLLDYIESDNLQPPHLAAQGSGLQAAYQSHKLLFLLGIPIFVLGAVVLALVFRNGENGNGGGGGAAQQLEACRVNFPDTTLNILLLPFFRPTADPIQVEGLILERLEDVSGRLGLNTQVKLCQDFQPASLLNYPDADVIGRRNRAGLIIWGRAERGKDINVIKTRYKYLGNTDTIPFARLRWQGEKQIASDKVLSIITSQGELTEDIEATVMLALGLFADQTGNKEAALIAFENANVSDSAAVLVRNMMLADAYLENNQPEKAIASLDTLLNVHPDYWLGRNNRALLRLEAGDNLGAIEDLSVALVKRPTDPDLLLARGTAFEKSDQLYQAKADFEKFTESSPERAPEVSEKLRTTNARIKRLETVIEQTQAKPDSRQSRQDIINAADASRQLGDTRQASQLAEKGLRISPNDPKLIAIQVENLLKERKTEEARTLLNDALRRGVNRADLDRHSTIVKNFPIRE